jgi:tricorn protease
MRPRSLPSSVAFLVAIALLAWAGAAGAQEETRLLRFPHIHGNTVVFTYAGDLYTAPLSGGEARRLTSHEGLEIFARFSPDGQWIAFSGEYAGTRQVYVIPSCRRHPSAAHLLSRRWAHGSEGGLRPPGAGLDTGRLEDPGEDGPDPLGREGGELLPGGPGERRA